MGKMKAVFDTNILIDYLNGVYEAADEIRQYEERNIRILTWMEVLAGINNTVEENVIHGFLSTFNIIDLDIHTAERAVKLRKTHRMKLPDAIIYATAQESGCIFVTRNSKDFQPSWPDVRVPYQI